MPAPKDVVPAPPAPAIRRLDTASWAVAAGSEKGPVRPRLEDAYALLAGVPCGGRQVDAFAVFDGLGGMPRGREAARAAAGGLAQALAQAAGAAGVLPALNPRVLRAGGATTAVVAVSPLDDPGRLTLLSVGDSSAYALDGAGRPRGLVPHDAAGPHTVTDHLGNPGLRGHAVPLDLPAGGALLLCSDGVDGVAGPSHLEEALRHDGSSLEDAVRRLLAEVARRGMPDNATVVLARRRGAAQGVFPPTPPPARNPPVRRRTHRQA